MASISGSNAKAGVKVATTWGTPVAVGAGNQLVAEITPSGNEELLVARSVGSGRHMTNSHTRGNYIPTISLVGDAGYRNNMDTIIAQMWGTSGAPSEVTASQSDYKHTITFNTTLNAKYLTLAYETTTTTTHEFPTCAVRQFGLRTTSVPGYLEWSAELLAGVLNLSSSTNNTAALANVTLTDTELAAVAFDDDFWIETAGGTISVADQYNITSFDFSATRPQEIQTEIKGASGNSAPVSSGLFEATLNIGVKELADHAYYTVWNAETIKKGIITVEGTQIGSGTNKTIKLLLPNLYLTALPGYALTDPGTNALSLSFNCQAPSSTESGMTGSVYPYFEITNGLSTSLLA